MAGVTVDRVSKSYGGVAALQEVSLELVDGEFLVLVGPSGCGKTTSLRMLAGFERLVGKPQAIIASSSYWGEQTFQEMALIYFDVRVDAKTTRRDFYTQERPSGN